MVLSCRNICINTHACTIIIYRQATTAEAGRKTPTIIAGFNRKRLIILWCAN